MTPWIVRQARAEGRWECVRCADELDADGTCAGCREAARDRQDDLRDARERERLCRCGRARADGRRQCRPCLELDAAYKRARVLEVEQGLMDRPK